MFDIDLVILGGGATGIEFADMVKFSAGPGVRIGIVDDDPSIGLSKWRQRGIPVLGPRSVLAELSAPFLVAVGETALLTELANAAGHAGLIPSTPVVHPSAVLAPGVKVGAGSVIYPQSALSTDVRLGRHCQVHLGVTLGHDVDVGSRCVITPGVNVSGGCRLGDEVFIGTGSALVPMVEVGAGTVIGAGSVVTGNLSSGVLAFGNPARVKRSLSPVDQPSI